jgi:hypothetical protein
MAIDQNQTGKIIRDLLRIAKVAMPGRLYDEDPRVLVARAALREMEESGAPARPPNLTSRSPTVNLSTLPPDRAVEMSARGASFVIELPWDIVDALHDAQNALERLDPAETVGFALRDWLTGQGYLKPAGEPN